VVLDGAGSVFGGTEVAAAAGSSALAAGAAEPGATAEVAVAVLMTAGAGSGAELQAVSTNKTSPARTAADCRELPTSAVRVFIGSPNSWVLAVGRLPSGSAEPD